MKTINRLTKGLLISAFGLCMTPNFALAKSEGGAHGGGGSFACQEYQKFASRLVYELAKIEKNENQLISELPIDISKYREIVNGDRSKKIEPLKCIPVTKLNRDAWSDIETNTTDLKWETWEKQIAYKKYELAMHEINVLAGYENDGSYDTTLDIFEAIKQSKSKLKYEFVAEQVIFDNKNLSVTFIKPFNIINDAIVYFGIRKSNYKEYFLILKTEDYEQMDYAIPSYICKNLGFNKALNFSVSKDKLSTFLSANRNGALESINGGTKTEKGSIVILSAKTTYTSHAFDTLTCK